MRRRTTPSTWASAAPATTSIICIYLQSTVSNEQRCTSAARPGAWRVVAPREREFRYEADHVGNRWIIRTNADGAKNYKLVELADADAARGRSAWRDLVPHSADVFIENFQPFDSFVAIEERAGGNKHIRLLGNSGRSSDVASDEPAYAMEIGDNREVNATKLRYTYDSLTTPEITYEVDANTGARTVLKRTPAPNYDPSQYVTERVWATARDGTKIPVSLVYRKGFKRDGTAAMLQYGYGSYGLSMDPAYSSIVPSFLDRGMVYAIAHVRGGQEMGRAWYDAGHLLNKKNTFTDFIDVTRYLVANGYAAKDRVAASGGSAGGLLMGAIANMAPQDYRVIITQVPFVDAVTTMLDASIPLTSNEWDEWGNPAERQYYDYMLSLLALRPDQPPGLSGDVRRHRPVGQPGPILRADQICRQAAGDEDRHQSAGVPDQHGSGARRQVGPVRAISLAGRILRLHAVAAWVSPSRPRSTSTGHSPAPRRTGLKPSFS